MPGGMSLVSGLQAAAAGGAIPDLCPVCGLKLSPEEWHTHFLTELDRLYKLSAGFERANLQATYMFAPPCPAQENAIRTSHNRWEVSWPEDHPEWQRNFRIFGLSDLSADSQQSTESTAAEGAQA